MAERDCVILVDSDFEAKEHGMVKNTSMEFKTRIEAKVKTTQLTEALRSIYDPELRLKVPLDLKCKRVPSRLGVGMQESLLMCPCRTPLRTC
jgi:hypothetical protein